MSAPGRSQVRASRSAKRGGSPMTHPIVRLLVTVAAAFVVAGSPRAEEPPALEADVAAGRLPPLAQRLPHPPLVVDIRRNDWTEGVYGGEMRMLMAKDRDIRMMVVYGYSRLVGYDERLRIVPDILDK